MKKITKGKLLLFFKQMPVIHPVLLDGPVTILMLSLQLEYALAVLVVVVLEHTAWLPREC